MSKKTKEEAEKTRRRILASALALFSSRGYDRTTFNDIAARLKLTKGAIYWHFESKEAVLIELVRMALEKFRRQIESVMPEGELSFPQVAEMMVKNAAIVVGDPKAAAFFRLMKCQIRWGDESMAEVRTKLLTNEDFGPKEAFRRAIANDIAAGRARASVDAEEVSTVAIALWDDDAEWKQVEGAVDQLAAKFGSGAITRAAFLASERRGRHVPAYDRPPENSD